MKITKRIEGWVETGVRIFFRTAVPELLPRERCGIRCELGDNRLKPQCSQMIQHTSANQILNNYRPYRKSKKYGWQIAIQVNFFQWLHQFFHEKCCFFFLFNFYNFWEHFDQYTLSWKKNCISHVPVQSLFSKKRMTKSFICIHQCIRNLLHVLSQFIKEIVDYTCK